MLKAEETSGNILFEEKQNFPKWLNILMVGTLLWTLAIILIPGFNGVKEQRNDMWITLAIAIPLEILIIILFQYVQLQKIVTSNSVYYRWKPWQRKFRVIEKESIESFEVRKSPPLNYGIHWFPGYGWVHNASAGEGMQLYLVNGKKIFFSTSDITFFKKALGQIVYNLKPGMREF